MVWSKNGSFYVTKPNIHEPTKLQHLRYGHDAVSFISWPAEILASVYKLSNSSPFSDSNGPINWMASKRGKMHNADLSYWQDLQAYCLHLRLPYVRVWTGFLESQLSLSRRRGNHPGFFTMKSRNTISSFYKADCVWLERGSKQFSRFTRAILRHPFTQ